MFGGSKAETPKQVVESKLSLRSWQGDVLVIFVLALLAGCCYGAYIFAMQITQSIQEQMGGNNRLSVNSKGVNIKVRHQNHETTLNNARKGAMKLWENSKAPDSYNGLFKYREKPDKRKINKANATAGINNGWA